MTNILGLWVSALLSIIWGIFCLILQIRLCKIVGCLKADKWTKTSFSCKWQKTIKIISPSSNGSKQWLWTCWCLKNCLRWFCLLFPIVFYSRVACRVSNFQPKRWLDHFKFQGDSISSTNYRVSYMTNILNFCPNCKFVSRSVRQNFVKNNKLCLRRRHENVVKLPPFFLIIKLTAKTINVYIQIYNLYTILEFRILFHSVSLIKSSNLYFY